MKEIKIGLLPLYLELYDECCADSRSGFEEFHQTIIREYEKRDITVISVPLCRVEEEFSKAVKGFEEAQVDAIVTLHLAYSPSLESSRVLAETDLPIVILDTTVDYEFGFEQKSEAIMFNHGIHGVQDMCNLLIRNNKKFSIEAGHWQESDVIDRSIEHLKACRLAMSIRRARTGIIGQPFAGMGDFAIAFDVLKQSIGMDVISLENNTFKTLLSEVSEEQEKSEIQDNLDVFESGQFSEKAMSDTARTCLAVRRWTESENLNAFTVNFLNVNKASGISAVPFLEASKGMARGMGYAGEGDVLCATLVAALMSVFRETTFTEIFCPDWKGNKLFLSHMGEINTALCVGKAILEEKPFPFTDADNPVVAIGQFKPGNAYLVNLAPGPNGIYSLICAAVKVHDSKGSENIKNAIRGWVEPSLPVADFLTAYSKLGGTHHLAMSYNADLTVLKEFAENMGWNFESI